MSGSLCGSVGKLEKQADPNKRIVPVCISCDPKCPNTENIAIHEMEHVKRICRTGKDFTTCQECVASEEAAYRVSCKELFKDRKKQRCVNCGVYLGCYQLCKEKGSLEFLATQTAHVTDCTEKDIGFA